MNKYEYLDVVRGRKTIRTLPMDDATINLPCYKLVGPYNYKPIDLTDKRFYWERIPEEFDT